MGINDKGLGLCVQFVVGVVTSLLLVSQVFGAATFDDLDRGESVLLESGVADAGSTTYQWYYGAVGDRSIPIEVGIEENLLIPEFHDDSQFWVEVDAASTPQSIGPFVLSAQEDAVVSYTRMEPWDGHNLSEAINVHPNWERTTNASYGGLLDSFFIDQGQALFNGFSSLDGPEDYILRMHLEPVVDATDVWSTAFDFALAESDNGQTDLFGFSLVDVSELSYFGVYIDDTDNRLYVDDVSGALVAQDYFVTPLVKYTFELLVDFTAETWSLLINGSVILADQSLPAHAGTWDPAAVDFIWRVPGSTSGNGYVLIDDILIERAQDAPFPVITTQTASVGGFVGEEVALSVSASGYAPLSYTWYRGPVGDVGNSVVFETGSASVPLTVRADDSSVWVRVSNVFGAVDSAEIPVTVEDRSELYRYSFDAEDSYSLGALNGQDGWSESGATGGNFVVDRSGEQWAKLGGGALNGTNLWMNSSEMRLYTGSGRIRQVSGTVEFEGTGDDRFGFQLYTFYGRILTLMFAFSNDGIYASEADGEGTLLHTGYVFETGVPYEVDFFVDYQWYRYSVRIGDVWVVKDHPMDDAEDGDWPYDLRPFWWVTDSPDSNAMLLNDFSVYSVDVYPSPRVTGMSLPLTVSSGEAASVSVDATGFGVLNYQWYTGHPGDTTTPVGEDSPILELASMLSSQRYWVRVSNELGSVDSASVHVAVDTPYWGQFDVVSEFSASGYARGEVVVSGDLAAVSYGYGFGGVWLYQRVNEQWYPLTQFDGGAGVSYNSNFGSSLALDGDLLAVGAPGQPSSVSSGGAVYLFKQDAEDPAVWNRVKEVVLDAPVDGDAFGASVGLKDGILVVGSPRGASSYGGTPNFNPGRVHVFSRDQGGVDQWGLITTIEDPDANNSAKFAECLDFEGGALIVGAPSQSSGVSGGGVHGCAYVFGQNSGGANAFGLLRKLLPEVRTDQAKFGSAVAISDSWAVVGEPDRRVLGPYNAGHAYVYGKDVGGANDWGLSTVLKDPVPGEYRQFGGSVAVSGDTLVVGQDQISKDLLRGICLFVYDTEAGSWQHEQWPQRVLDSANNLATTNAFAMEDGLLAIADETTSSLYFFEETPSDLPPKLLASQISLLAIDKNIPDGDNSGQLIGDFVGGLIQDGNGDTTGILLTADLGGLDGHWEYRLSGASEWILVDSISSTAGIVLRSDDHLRFVPDAWAFGTAQLEFYGWSGIELPSGSIVSRLTPPSGALFSAAAGTIEIVVTDTNEYPYFLTYPPLEGFSGIPFEYLVALDDANSGQPIAITATELPAWMTFTDNGDRTGVLSGNPSDVEIGDWDVTLRGFDGESGPATQSFTVSIRESGLPGWSQAELLPTDDMNIQYAQALTDEYLVISGRGASSISVVDIYHILNDGTIEHAIRLTAPNGSSSSFGRSVAVDADGFVYVGDEQGNTETGDRTGAVYIYGRDVGGRNQYGLFKTLIGSQTEISDYFGEAICLRDGRLFVFARNESASDTSNGVVYIFERDKTGVLEWGEAARLTLPGTPYWLNAGAILGDSDTCILYDKSYQPTDSSLETYISGRLVIYTRAVDGTWAFSKYIDHPVVVKSGSNARSLDFDGDRIVVSSSRQSDRTQIYGRNVGGANNWGLESDLDLSSLGTVSIYGDRLVVKNSNFTLGLYQKDTDSGDWVFETELGSAFQSSSFGAYIDQSATYILGGGGSLVDPLGAVLFEVGLQNIAPSLSLPPSLVLGQIAEDESDDALGSWKISDLLEGASIDYNGNDLGVAVRPVDLNGSLSQGTWQYLRDNGSWSTISYISDTRYLLLPPHSEIRFRPAADYAGDSQPRLVVRAWDMTIGALFTYFDTGGVTGGSSAISSAYSELKVEVLPEPDAPVFVDAGVQVFEAGDSVDLIVSFTDVDEGDSITIEAGDIPAWLTAEDLLNGSLRLSGTVPLDSAGVLSVHLTATDSFGYEGTGFVELTLFGNGQLGAPYVEDGISNYSRYGQQIVLDGDTLVVKGVGDATYLYYRDTEDPSQWDLHKLFNTPITNFSSAYFSMSLQGDTLVISSLYYRENNVIRGGIAIYQRDEGGSNNWGQTQMIYPPDTTGNISFGCSIDFDGERIVVGAQNDSAGGNSSSGSAYIYEYNSGTGQFDYLHKLLVPSLPASSQFGQRVSIEGDLVAVHSKSRVGGSYPYGYLYLFEKDYSGVDTWGNSALLHSASETSNENFGASFSLDSGVLSVGLPFYRGGPSNSTIGAVQLYAKDENELWVPTLLIENPLPTTSSTSYFGQMLSVSENRLVVSAPRLDTDYGRGAVFEFTALNAERSEWALEGLYYNHLGSQTELRQLYEFGHTGLAHGPREIFVGLSDYVSVTQTPASPEGLIIRYEKEFSDIPSSIWRQERLQWPDVEQYAMGSFLPAQLLSDMVDGILVSRDPFSLNLVVTEVAPTDGVWEYLLNDATEWVAFPETVSDTAAVVLPQTAQIRFAPGSSSLGLIEGALSLKTLRGESIDTVQLVDLTQAGQADKLSETALLVDVPIVAGNQAPVLLTNAIDPYTDDHSTPTDQRQVVRVSDLLDGIVSDANPGDALGIAVTSVSHVTTAQYSIDGGATWSIFRWTSTGYNCHRYGCSPYTIYHSPIPTAARLLGPDALIRFTSTGTCTVQFKAWDGTSQLTDTTVSGGTSSFSVESNQFEFVIVPPVDTPDAPWINASGSGIGAVDLPYSVVFSAGDADVGDELTFTVSGMPDWLVESRNGNQVVFEGTPTASDVGNESITVEVEDLTGLSSSATHSFSVVSGFSTETGISIPGVSSSFGSSIAATPDFVAIGDQSAQVADFTQAGEVHIFEINGSSEWVLIKTLQHPDPKSYGRFGQRVVMDGENLFVHAPEGDNTSSTDQILHYRSSHGGVNNWGLVKTITAASANSYWGGDFDVDGDTLVVRANYVDTSYVLDIHHRNSGGTDQWGVVKTLDIASDRFGTSFDVQDGLCAVADPWHDSAPDVTDNVGAIYLFSEASGWAQTGLVTLGGTVRTIGNVELSQGDLFIYTYLSEDMYSSESYIAQFRPSVSMSEPIAILDIPYGGSSYSEIIWSDDELSFYINDEDYIIGFERSSIAASDWTLAKRFSPPALQHDGLKAVGGDFLYTYGSNGVGITALGVPSVSAPMWSGNGNLPWGTYIEDMGADAVPFYLVSDLIKYQFADDDFDYTGLALSGWDPALGDWQWRLGATAWTTLGAPAADQHFLLQPLAELRFIPAPNLDGQVLGFVEVALWDQSIGSAQTSDSSGNLAGALSSGMTQSLDIQSVNDQPVLVGTADEMLAADRILDTEAWVIYLTAETILGGTTSDVDHVDLGVALSFIDQTVGQWSYRVGGSGEWLDLDPVSEQYAFMLPADGVLRCELATPGAQSITALLRYRAWDGYSFAPADYSFIETIAWDTTHSFSSSYGQLDLNITPQWILKLNGSEAAAIHTFSGEGVYADGSLATVNAQLQPGYRFEMWSGAVVANSDQSQTTLTMSQDVHLVANVLIDSTDAYNAYVSVFGGEHDILKIGPQADFDQDSFTNFFEYVFGMNPIGVGAEVASTLSIDEEGESAFLRLSFTARSDDGELTYTVRQSGDLLTWDSVDLVFSDGQWLSDDETIEVVASVDNGDGSWALTVERTTPIDAQTTSFMRVDVKSDD